MSHRIPTRLGKPEREVLPTQNQVYMWDLSYHGWLDAGERREFWDWAFGPYMPDQQSVEAIAFLLQRPVSSNFGGKEDQVLLVEGPLAPDEYLLIERYVEYCWHILPRFLEDRRRHALSRTDRSWHRRELVV